MNKSDKLSEMWKFEVSSQQLDKKKYYNNAHFQFDDLFSSGNRGFEI